MLETSLYYYPFFLTFVQSQALKVAIINILLNYSDQDAYQDLLVANVHIKCTEMTILNVR